MVHQTILTKDARKIVIILATIIIIMPTVISGEAQIATQLWNRYTARYDDGQCTQSEFALKRGYLSFAPTFSEKIKGRFNIDIFSDDDAVDGAGVKLKYAWLDFHNYLPAHENTISAGLIKNYFGTVYDWNYTTIERSLEDKENILASADYGVALSGALPSGYGEYIISITNGESYKKTGAEINVNPEYKANLRMIIIPGLTFGGSLLYENIAPDSSATAIDNLAYAGLGHFISGPVELWSEYLTNKLEALTSSGFMVMPIISLNNITRLDVDLIGRFDYWDPNTKVNDDGHYTTIAGFNWNIIRDVKNKPQIFIQVNWQREMHEDGAVEAVDTYMVQLRWSYSHTLNN